MTALHLIELIGSYLAFVSILIAIAKRAPWGWQDRTGFHYGEPPEPPTQDSNTFHDVGDY